MASTDQAPLLVCALEGPEISGDDDNPAASKGRRLRQELIGETHPSAADAATNEIDHSLSIVIVVLSSNDPARTVISSLMNLPRHLLAVPRFRLNTYGRRAFSVAGPMAWNSLPDFIRDPTSSTDCFRRLLKTYLFRALLVHPAH